MTASYPGSIKTFIAKADYVDSILAAHINDLQEEVAALETILGVNAHGSAASVAARLSAIDAAWSAFTPTWTSSGSAPSIGNGTLVGAYRQIGKLVVARVKLTIGSTTNKGTGNWRFGYPVPPNSATVNSAIGSASARDATNGRTYLGQFFGATTGYCQVTLGQTLVQDSGTEALVFSSDTSKSKAITFGVPFSNTPLLAVSADNDGFSAWYDSLNASGATLHLFKADGTTASATRSVKWRALGNVEQTVDNATPFTFATGDILAGTLVYEAA